MDKNEALELVEVLSRQEEQLVFEHFSNKDALKLGIFMTERVYQKGIGLAVAIRRLSGAIIFQHMPETATLNSQNWMKRKFNTVALMEHSSLFAWAKSVADGEPLEHHGLSASEYVLCGGGFPIRLKSGETVAVLTVSGLSHTDDHRFIVEILRDWIDLEFS